MAAVFSNGLGVNYVGKVDIRAITDQQKYRVFSPILTVTENLMQIQIFSFETRNTSRALANSNSNSNSNRTNITGLSLLQNLSPTKLSEIK